MSERNVLLLLHDIQTSIIKILNYTEGITFEQYEADIKTKDAVERNFAIIGEAAAKVPAEFKQRYATIEWSIIKDFRNFIVHEYFGINNTIVWDIIQNHLPVLLLTIAGLIKSIDE